jgi:hypothetical protein
MVLETSLFTMNLPIQCQAKTEMTGVTKETVRIKIINNLISLLEGLTSHGIYLITK